MTYELYWTFRNNHEWYKQFDNFDSLCSFINTCGLVSHPDVLSVRYTTNQLTNEVKHLKVTHK